MDLELPILGAPPRSKPHRQDLAPGDCLCNYCTAKCCRYFALPLDTPTTWKDFDFLRWFLLHERASAFVEDGTWYLLVHTLCRHLARITCAAFTRRVRTSAAPTRPPIANTRTIGSTITTWKRPRRSRSTPWPGWGRGAARVFAAPSPPLRRAAPQKRTSSKSDRGASGATDHASMVPGVSSSADNTVGQANRGIRQSIHDGAMPSALPVLASSAP